MSQMSLLAAAGDTRDGPALLVSSAYYDVLVDLVLLLLF